jgi:class 3 adenylate cyclase
MMNTPSTVPLFFRTAAILLLPVLILSLVHVVITTDREEERIIADRFAQWAMILDIMADQSRIPLLENDELLLNDLTRKMHEQQDIAVAAVTDPSRRIIAHSVPSRVETALQSPPGEELRSPADLARVLNKGSEKAFLSKPVTFQSRVLGTVMLEPALQDLRHQLANLGQPVLKQLLFPVASAGMLIVVLSLGLSRSWKLSLNRLTLAISECMIGESVHSTPRLRPAELHQVLDSVQNMSEKCRFELTRLKGLETANRKSFFSMLKPPQEETWPLEITRTQVTVMFAGIKGFRSYAQKRNPLELLQDLNEFFELAKRSIAFKGGYIDKFIGDALIAVFTPSPEHGAHTRNAVESSLALQHVLAKTGQEGGNSLLSQVGIGISSGVVISGHFGEGEHKTHTFIGESFKAAYSLNIMAGPGEILISRDVYELLENHISAEPVPPLEMTRTTASWENFRLIQTHDRASS